MDEDRLCRMFVKAFEHAYHLLGIQVDRVFLSTAFTDTRNAILANPGEWCFLTLREGEKIVAFVAWQHIPPGLVYVAQLAVRASFQCKGISKKVIGLLKQKLAPNTRVFFLVRRNNETMLHLCDYLGARPCDDLAYSGYDLSVYQAYSLVYLGTTGPHCLRPPNSRYNTSCDYVPPAVA